MDYPNSLAKEVDLSNDSSFTSPGSLGIIYRNPRIYNVDYSFELIPDPTKIDPSKDLKLWLPIPREWDSQKAVKIISIQPSPHATYEDPEHGNPMLYWDFGKEPERSSYKVELRCRLKSYEVQAEIDPGKMGSYDKTSKEYALYTLSTHTISITPKVREMAQIAIGEEMNPYLQARRIQEFVGKKVHYKILDHVRGRGIECLLGHPVIDEDTGEEYYEGACNEKSALFIAMCRAVGIPARSVQGIGGWSPWAKEEDLKPLYAFETELSPSGLAGAQAYGVLRRHTWAEFYIPNSGWIPADPTSGRASRFIP
jgi:transglutaminase-like putative cysteine protease